MRLLFQYGREAAENDLASILPATTKISFFDVNRFERLGVASSEREVAHLARGEAAQSFIVVKDGLVAVQRSTVDGGNVLVACIMSRWSKAGWIRGSAPKLELLRLDMLRRMARDAAGASLPDIRSALE